MEEDKKFIKYKNTNQDFKIWYNYDDFYKIYNVKTDTFETTERLPEECNSYYLPTNYTLTQKKIKKEGISIEDYNLYLEEQTRKYSLQIVKDAYELKTDYDKDDINSLRLKFDYFDKSIKLKKHNDNIYYRTHKRNVISFFKKLCKNPDKSYKYSNFDNIGFNEYNWFKKCKNCGLMYLKEKNTIYKNVYGYDYKMSYPTDMADISFMMPTKEGKEVYNYKIPENPKFISFGIYRCIIECEDPNFRKVFMTSEENYYTSYSLKFAFELRTKFKIKIQMINDKKPNAYIYDRKDLIHGKDIFGNWYYRLLYLKNKYPKNGLVKLLSSSGWGHFQEVKLLYKTTEQLIKMKDEGKIISMTNSVECDYYVEDVKPVGDTNLYSLIDTKKGVYDIPFRLLPFITSFSRVKMGRLIHKADLYDKVIRIQTDSIIFDSPLEINYKGFIQDDKITGDIEFKNVNDYVKL
jgi:hypothetical protein